VGGMVGREGHLRLGRNKIDQPLATLSGHKCEGQGCPILKSDFQEKVDVGSRPGRGGERGEGNAGLLD